MRVRTEHWALLLSICEKNPELITNRFNGPEGKSKGHILWQNVAQQLNSLGFGEKTKEDWRKVKLFMLLSIYRLFFFLFRRL